MGHTPTVYNYEQWGRVRSPAGRIENGQDTRSNRARRPQRLTTHRGTSQWRLQSKEGMNATISQSYPTPNEQIPWSETHSYALRIERSCRPISHISLVQWAEWRTRSRPTIKYTSDRGKSHWSWNPLDDAYYLLLVKRDPAEQLPWGKTNQGMCIMIYHITGDAIQKRFSLPYLKCLMPAEAEYVLREIHEGICGNHSGVRSLSKKVIIVGYY